jgi:D-alanyl-D-alanine carboxypeptidase/D-alanyl-D-alanine-endopeptidase (penicillin-binding protein 4)
MSAIVSEMLTFSDNNTAELLVKLLGSTKGEGSTTKGLSVVLDSLKSKGFPTEGLVLLDGSGLDDTNRVSCNLLESILRADGVHGTLSDGLAVADGDVGTLRDRYRGSPAAKKVRAKTGTLKSVSALSGWVHADTGRDLTFSIVLNTPGRDIGASDLRLQERITEAMLSYPDTIDPVLVSPVSPK